jgi:hypothetical protein
LARGWKGVSTLIPGLVMTSLLIIVTALLIARMLDSISLAVEQRRTPLYTMKITWANYTEIYGGPSLELDIVNDGPEALYDLGVLEVIVSYESSGSRIAEILKFKREASLWTPGYWSVERIEVSGITLTYEAHPYLRPGERVLIKAYISRQPSTGTLISIAVISPEAVKAEFSLAR